MILTYKETEYNNKINCLTGNGKTVETVNIDYDEFTTSEDMLSLTGEFVLPGGARSYRDFNAIIVWGSYLNDNNKRIYSGIPAPIVFDAKNDGDKVRVTYAFEDLEVETDEQGDPINASEPNVRLTISLSDELVTKDNDFGNFINNLECITFISDDRYTMTPDDTVIFPSIKVFFDQVTTVQENQFSIEGKTKFLSFGDDEYDSVNSAYKYYDIVPCEQIGSGNKVMFDGEYYYTDSSLIKLKELPAGYMSTMVGFTVEEMEDADKASEIEEAANSNAEKFAEDVTKSVNDCLYLRKDLIYPIGGSLQLKSNICIDGNGSTILAYKTIPTYDPNDPTATPSYNLDVITNANSDCDITDVTFKNLTFKGRYNETTEPRMDQCIKFDTGYPHMLKKFKFENVTFDGFQYDIHITNSTGHSQDIENLNWSINNCKFLKSGIPVMFKSTNGVEITNSYFDGSVNTTKYEHCIYLGGSCYNITVDKCLFENCFGSAINQHCADTTDWSSVVYNHNNCFTNLTVRNCKSAVAIGAMSRDILVENIFATNVIAGIKLESCYNVTVNNLYATSSFSNVHVIGNNKFEYSESNWSGIIVKGSVEAELNNCYFKTGGPMFYCSPYLEEAISENGAIESVAINGPFPEFFDPEAENLIVTDLKFNNCIFDTTYNNASYLGYDKAEMLKYYYDVAFNNCQFNIRSDIRLDSSIKVTGYASNKSQYLFKDCCICVHYDSAETDIRLRYYDEKILSSKGESPRLYEEVMNYVEGLLGETYTDDNAAVITSMFADYKPSEAKTMKNKYFLTCYSTTADCEMNNCTIYQYPNKNQGTYYAGGLLPTSTCAVENLYTEN